MVSFEVFVPLDYKHHTIPLDDTELLLGLDGFHKLGFVVLLQVFDLLRGVRREVLDVFLLHQLVDVMLVLDRLLKPVMLLVLEELLERFSH